MIQQRTKRNSSKVNLIVSLVFHSILVACIFYFAAKEGLLGKKLKQLTVTMEKVKKPEPAKEKPQEPKPEQPKPQEAKTSVPQPKVETVQAPPPAAASAAGPAPAAVALPSFAFSDGAIDVQSINDPNGVYRNLVEHTLRAIWNRPTDIPDDNFTAEVELTVDKTGYVEDSRWVKGSGNERWDQSVRDAISQLKTISRPPPKGFPHQFVVRFDVETTKEQPIEFSVR
jgi:TonB family protein